MLQLSLSSQLSQRAPRRAARLTALATSIELAVERGVAMAPAPLSTAFAGGSAPIVFAAAGLPAGLGLSADGVMSGAATGPSGSLGVVVTARDARGDTASVSLVLTVVEPVVAPKLSAAPVISGTATVGQTLSCSTGAWTNGPEDFAWQWLRNGAPIAGATASAYALAPADAGATISCRVTARNAGGSATADAPGVTLPAVPANAGAPVISGTAAVGQTLSCSTGTWTNGPEDFAWQWLRNGAPIAGATASAYALAPADAGATISCRVTARNAGGSATADAPGVTFTATAAPSPAATTPPVIAGTAVVGQTLTCSTGSWANAPTGYAYQWFRDGLTISGATAATYVLVQADTGRSIACRVTASNATGSGQAVASARFVAIATESWARNGGTSYLVRNTGLSDASPNDLAADGDSMTIAFRALIPASAIGVARRIWQMFGRGFLEITSGGLLQITIRDTANTTIGVWRSTSSITDSVEHIYMLSVRHAAGNLAFNITRDGVALPGSWTTAQAAGTIDHTRTAMTWLASTAFADFVHADTRWKWLYWSTEYQSSATAFGTPAAPVNPATVGTPRVLFATPADIVSGNNTGTPRNVADMDFTPTGGGLETVTTGGAATVHDPLALGPGRLALGAYKTTDAPEIRRVTNRNDSGAGSFRSAVSGDTPAIVLFDVGGQIALTGGECIIGSYKTIVGESAPEPVTFTRSRIVARGSEIVMTGLAVRPGDDMPGQAGGERDGIVISRGSASAPSRIMIRNCSVTWGMDEAGGAWAGCSEFTWQDCLLAEGFISAQHPDNNTPSWPGEQHAFGPYFGGPSGPDCPTDFAFVRNLVTTFRDRSPQLGEADRAVIAENLIYNWMVTGLSAFAADEIDIRNNWFKAGPQTGSAQTGRSIRLLNNGDFYVNGNQTNTTTDTAVSDAGVNLAGAARAASIYTPTLTAAQVRDFVLANVGARRGGSLDPIDQRIVDYVAAEGPTTGPGRTYNEVVSNFRDFDDYEPTLGTAARADVNGDGIVDAYETALGVPVGSISPHALINATAAGLNARWNGHRRAAHQAHWLRTGSIDAV